jgi:hypothetical protein
MKTLDRRARGSLPPRLAFFLNGCDGSEDPMIPPTTPPTAAATVPVTTPVWDHEAKCSTAQFLSGIATGRMGEPVAPRNLMQAPKKTYS